MRLVDTYAVLDSYCNWISVRDALPEDPTPVLATVENSVLGRKRYVYPASYYTDEGYWVDMRGIPFAPDSVIAWECFPAPYDGR